MTITQCLVLITLSLGEFDPHLLFQRYNSSNNIKRSLFTMNLINYTIDLPKGRELKK